MTKAFRTVFLGLLATVTLPSVVDRANAQEAPTASTSFEDTYSILGVSFGDTAQQAQERFEGGYELVERTARIEEYPAGFAGGNAQGIGQLSLTATPARDGMELLLSTPETGGRVVAMARSLAPATDDYVAADAFLASLKAKYGEPSYEDSGQMAWLHDETGKKVEVSGFRTGATALVETLLENSPQGVPTCWGQLSGDDYGGTRGLPSPYSYSTYRPGLQDCRGGLYVRFSQSGNKLGLAHFLAIDHQAMIEDQAGMDARVISELENAPRPPAGDLPKL